MSAMRSFPNPTDLLVKDCFVHALPAELKTAVEKTLNVKKKKTSPEELLVEKKLCRKNSSEKNCVGITPCRNNSLSKKNCVGKTPCRKKTVSEKTVSKKNCVGKTSCLKKTVSEKRLVGKTLCRKNLVGTAFCRSGICRNVVKPRGYS